MVELISMKLKPTINVIEGEGWGDLESLEKEVRKEIGVFHVTKVTQAARWLERTDDLQKKHAALQNELGERLREGRSLLKPIVSVNGQKFESALEAKESEFEALGAGGGKARGRECRAAFVAQQARDGKPLTRVRGALYKNRGGATVGIAYAMVRKNEWFLGLPAGEFKEAVLLCEATGGKIQPIHLPETFIEKYGKRLSVSSQYNQAKFSVQFRAGRYNLVVNGIGDVDLTDYVVGQPFVCPRTEYI